MKQNDTINILLLFFCILLLGFVYVNTKMADDFNKDQDEAFYEAQPAMEDNNAEIIE